jgi:lactate dehydrogenase-like 2-hydroxyacid dehydrogenase
MKNGLNMNVAYYDVNRNEQAEKELGLEYKELNDLLKDSDFISVHVPLLPTTKHLIGAEQMKMMKDSAYLINTSRGPIIDETALVEALKNNVIKGAALDVFEAEPKMAPGLAELDNVIVVPHIASATEETRQKMSEIAAENIIAVLEGGAPINPIGK